MEKYFYAKDKANIYDETIELVVPNYYQILTVVFNLLNNIFDGNEKLNIQDIGSGTGNDSIPILKSFHKSKLYACDINKDMKNIFELNVKKEKINQNRFEFEVQDYRDINYNKKFFDISISSYCIHHYTFNLKMDFFKKIYSELKKGGYFILIDLMNFDSKSLSNYCHQHDLDFINKSFNKRAKHADKVANVKLIRARDEWLHHMDNDNILDTTKIQMNGLYDIGFGSVECIYKYLQHSIIICKK